MQPSNSNLKAIVECVPPQTYTEVCAFLGLVDHYRRFIKGFTHIAQPLNEHLAGEGDSRKSEWVSLSEDDLKAFEALKQACMAAPILAFADYTKPFLLEADTSKDGLGQCCHRNKHTDGTTLLPMAARAIMPQEKNYNMTKLEFLALTWVVIEHYKEFLPYQSFW